MCLPSNFRQTTRDWAALAALAPAVVSEEQELLLAVLFELRALLDQLDTPFDPVG